MREIIYRGKRIDNGEWVYGDLVHFGSTKGKLVFIREPLTDTYHPVSVSSVSQGTGLLDKNGKMIFEGDVVKQFPRASWGDFSRVEIGKVFWEENTLQWKRTGKDINGEKFMTFCMAKVCVYEVVGNIHDTPQLLEVRE